MTRDSRNGHKGGRIDRAALLDGVTHLVWDWNGTLIDDVELCRAALNHMLERRGLPPVDATTHAAHFGFPIRPYYEHVGFDFAKESFDEVSRQFVDFYEARRENLPVRKGARQALKAATGIGLGQSLLSAYHEDLLTRLVRERGLDSHFQSLNGTDNLNAEGKIARGQRWLQEAGLRPQELLLIGDTLHDAELAEALGARCVLIESGHQSRDRLLATGCPVLSEFSELL